MSAPYDLRPRTRPERSLSVVIAAYNAERTLGRQLEALVGQGPGLDWEVVVADNRSTDGTVAVAQTFADRLELRVVPAPDKPSAAYARNVAVATCTAPWIAFVDADDMVAPGWVEAVARGLQEHPFVAGRLDAELLNSPAVFRSRPVPQSRGLQWWAVGPALPHAGGGNLGIHRSVYEAVGGFDEELVSLQDVDFCWRVQLTGVPLHFLPDATLNVGLRSSFRSMWQQGQQYGAAQAQLEQRFAGVTPAQIPLELQVARPTGAEHKIGRMDTLLGLVRELRRPGAFVWQVGWHVGHELGKRQARRNGSGGTALRPTSPLPSDR